MSKKIFCLIILLLLLISVSQAAADEASIESTIDFASKITNFSSGTANTILKIARNLFIGLATLSLIMGLARMLLTGESNVGTVFAHLAKWILYVGIFTWLMSSLSSASFIPKIIVNSFVKIGGTMGGDVEIAPDDILASGIRIYGIIVERGWNAGWGDFIGLTFIGILILVIIAITAGFFAVAVIEMHLIICGGAVLLGFGGFEYTRNIALSYLRYAISVGMKLLMITIVYALAIKLIPSWETEFKNASDMSALITQSGQILGGTICILMIVMIIPNIAQSIVNNASMSFGHNAPLVGYTSYVEARERYQPNSNSLVRTFVDAFRNTRSTARAANENSFAVPAYTKRTDEVMVGGSVLNPTNIGTEQVIAQQNLGNTETFNNYVPPARNERHTQVNRSNNR